ncbi:MAG: hypothetical protein KGL04_04740 [Elusimicrobia bacterium]|nr:hypothetical protein [Elusimicrobiota bacterium]
MMKNAAAAALILILGAPAVLGAEAAAKPKMETPARSEAGPKAPAAEKSEASDEIQDSARAWLLHLKEALTQATLAGDYQKGDVAQVAAVRGAPQQAVDADAPVWKGGFSDEARAELKTERAALAQGVELILDGHAAEGREKILAFEAQYPRSRLRGAAEEALRKAVSAPPATSGVAPAGKSSR